jgi:hypothetical protein
MSGTWRPNHKVRIMAQRMSREPDTAVAMAIGLSMPFPPRFNSRRSSRLRANVAILPPNDG